MSVDAKLAAPGDPKLGEPSTNKGKEEAKKDRVTVNTDAGLRIQYTNGEKTVATLLSLYLLVALVGVLWFILDIWAGKFSLFKFIGYPVVVDDASRGYAVVVDDTSRRLLRLVLYGMAGGWLGGIISAARSLQFHYTSPVENVGDLRKQEETRFHSAWWLRWFWGPWKGMGLALIVVALVQSGVLVFVASPEARTTVTQSFATLGLGALVGLAAKDVIEKLIKALKTWLKVEEPGAPKLQIRDGARVAYYGGEAITFKVEPEIPVAWTIDPADEKEVGTIINGVFRPAVTAPDDVAERTIIVTATSKAATDRSTSTSFVLKRKTEG